MYSASPIWRTPDRGTMLRRRESLSLRPDPWTRVRSEAHTRIVKAPLTPVDRLGQALHFLRMTGVMAPSFRIHRAMGPRIACVRRLFDVSHRDRRPLPASKSTDARIRVLQPGEFRAGAARGRSPVDERAWRSSGEAVRPSHASRSAIGTKFSGMAAAVRRRRLFPAWFASTTRRQLAS